MEIVEKIQTLVKFSESSAKKYINSIRNMFSNLLFYHTWAETNTT